MRAKFRAPPGATGTPGGGQQRDIKERRIGLGRGRRVGKKRKPARGGLGHTSSATEVSGQEKAAQVKSEGAGLRRYCWGAGRAMEMTTTQGA